MSNENEREESNEEREEFTRIYAVAQFGIGQLVACHGYPGEVFEVDVVKIESLRGIDFESTGVYYELIGIHSDLIIEGAQEDMTLVADVHEADDYIRANTGGKTIRGGVRYGYVRIWRILQRASVAQARRRSRRKLRSSRRRDIAQGRRRRLPDVRIIARRSSF